MDIKQFFKYDFNASIAVFLVALPLCLGIALASGAPLFAGLTAGIVGGIVAGILSGSNLSVSGPAAGLTTIVAYSIIKLGSYEAFLFSVMVAGMLQILFGFIKAGYAGHFFPASVVKGMLAAIGVILILKQIPHMTGYDRDFEGDENFIQSDGRNTFSEIFDAFTNISPAAVVIGLVAIAILVLWERPALKKLTLISILPAPLVIVGSGILLNFFCINYFPEYALGERHLVSLPGDHGKGIGSFFTFPDLKQWNNLQAYILAGSIALVASLETLLSTEACDKLDPYKRMTPLNRELKAQGCTNIVSGALGGLPVTCVIARSSANIQAGARTRAAVISHGVILLLSVLLIPNVLQLIPLASLAGLLIGVGYRLTKPSLYRVMYGKGISQFLPFIVTVGAVIFTDLLLGVFFGILVAVFFILKTNFGRALILVNNGNTYLLKLTKDVSFLNKSSLRIMFHTIPPGTQLLIDGSQSEFIDQDIKETIHDFMESAKSKNIQVELKNIALVS